MTIGVSLAWNVTDTCKHMDITKGGDWVWFVSIMVYYVYIKYSNLYQNGQQEKRKCFFHNIYYLQVLKKNVTLPIPWKLIND